MKKAALIVIMCVGVAIFASARVQVTWSTGPGGFGGIFVEEGGSVAGFDPIAGMWIEQGSIAQLVWTPVNSIPGTDIFPEDALASPRVGDVVLYTSSIGTGTGLAGTFLDEERIFDGTDYGLASDAFVGGYAYWRVFNAPLVGGDVAGVPADASLPVGTAYAIGTYANLGVDDTIHMNPVPLGNIDGSPPATLSAVNMVLNGVYDSDADVYVVELDKSVVPEPGTVLFGLVGVATILYRRHRARRRAA